MCERVNNGGPKEKQSRIRNENEAPSVFQRPCLYHGQGPMAGLEGGAGSNTRADGALLVTKGKECQKKKGDLACLAPFRPFP